ncbi:MAG: sugar transferase [Sulfitobacter sp.]
MFEQSTDNQVLKHSSFGRHNRMFPRYRGQGKRVLDLALSILLLPSVLPIIGILALAAKRDGGTAFFGHQRVGKNGKKFMCWKIRTMVPDAQDKLEALLKTDRLARKEWAEERKLTDDPRITWIGAFLRKSSLDELPQIWNVLKGEMSLIGPRPVPEDELAAKYATSQWVYKAVKPGISGMWQVSGRNDVSYAERIRLDIEYYENISLVLDLSIMGKTLGALINRTGQ